MRSTMMEAPLNQRHFLWCATAFFPKKEIVTRRDQSVHRYSYAAWVCR